MWLTFVMQSKRDKKSAVWLHFLSSTWRFDNPDSSRAFAYGFPWIESIDGAYPITLAVHLSFDHTHSAPFPLNKTQHSPPQHDRRYFDSH